MSNLPIRVEGLSKQYRIGGKAEPYFTLRDSLSQFAERLVSLISRNGRKDPEDTVFWALKDISFEVKQGEVIGIIGRNGAGKTTLLKILSRITEPTGGRAEICGRVGSLLEVGTGFHPELTGRENIYLNAAILGMKRAEIERRFDEIVAFSGIEKFLDTPVKRYSSGMHVRLAFAVAAHLDPEILIVDEVLAVGDADFQKKCLGKMGDVAKEGRTVLFVSHNMSAVQRLCSRAIVLNEGTILTDGSTDEALRKYLGMGMNQEGERSWADIGRAPGDEVVRLVGIRTKNQSGEVCSKFEVRDPVAIEIGFVVLKEERQLCVILELWNDMGQNLVLTFDNYIYGPWGRQSPYQKGKYKSTCLVPGDFLNEGRISITLAIFSPPYYPSADMHHVILRDSLAFTVVDRTEPGGVRGNYPYKWNPCAVRPRLEWVTERLPLDTTKLEKD